MAWWNQTGGTRKPIRRPRWARIEVRDDRIIVCCSNCNLVDHERVRRLHRLLTGVMTPNVQVVELDLRQVDGADTKLVASLVDAVRCARECGVKLVIHTSPNVRRLMEVCRLKQIIGVASGSDAPAERR